jgi:hypothetical protein
MRQYSYSVTGAVESWQVEIHVEPRVKTIGSEQGYVAVTTTGVCCTRYDCAPEHDKLVVGVPLDGSDVPFIVIAIAIFPGASVGAAFWIAVSVSAQGFEVLVRISCRYWAPVPTA